MNGLLEKISSYNILNYLFPGVLFAVLAGKIISRPLIQHDLFIGAFFYYFLGMVVSRFGSLVLEPILKYLRFVKFASYKDFVTAAHNDPKVDVLSEVNNTYRTLAAVFSLLLLLKLYVKLEAWFPGVKPWDEPALAILLLIMFLASYRKQTSYISKRVAATLKWEVDVPRVLVSGQSDQISQEKARQHAPK